jgi:hypothetical protein
MKSSPPTVSPALDKAIIEWLEAVFPDRCPDPSFSDRQVWMAVGEQRVIRKLRAELEKQQENSLRHVPR